ncbi:DUF664 domain-containing protein [Nakamurella flava]|uniref:DUF664 domain-containing protein n=1 Tax=Nakamurella flava TaxID=2576308 RepID=A0A4U6QJP0_9ACTN|nr:DinB family protein [Nakamurella flava]TKV60298.1 DUF664 domain-containing protein [Nakamurella flava]
MSDSSPGPFAVLTADADIQLTAFVEEYRRAMAAALDGLTEEQARRRLVPSRTTVMGLVKHATFLETVWFVEAVTGTPRTTLGLPQSVDDSFLVSDEDTVDSVRSAYEAATAAARAAMVGRSLDEVVSGHRAGPMTLRWIHLQVLRESAHHCGHVDILREQILAADGV